MSCSCSLFKSCGRAPIGEMPVSALCDPGVLDRAYTLATVLKLHCFFQLVQCRTMRTTPQLPVLYGDLINGVVFGFLFLKMVSDWMTLLVMAKDDGTSAATIDSIPWYHPVIVCSLCGMTVVCNIMALYHSRRPSFVADSDNQCTTTTFLNDSMYRMNLSRAWSYSAYTCLLVTTMASCWCNWPHVNEPPVLSQCAWHLVIATANVSHPASVKMIQCGASLLVGLVMLLYRPTALYSFSTMAPWLMVLSGTTIDALVCNVRVVGIVKSYNICAPLPCSVRLSALETVPGLSLTRSLLISTWSPKPCTVRPIAG
jgi:hypothetical protein